MNETCNETESEWTPNEAMQENTTNHHSELISNGRMSVPPRRGRCSATDRPLTFFAAVSSSSDSFAALGSLATESAGTASNETTTSAPPPSLTLPLALALALPSALSARRSRRFFGTNHGESMMRGNCGSRRSLGRDPSLSGTQRGKESSGGGDGSRAVTLLPRVEDVVDAEV